MFVSQRTNTGTYVLQICVDDTCIMADGIAEIKFIRDMRNPGFVSNSGLPEERSWPHACACFPTYEPLALGNVPTHVIAPALRPSWHFCELPPRLFGNGCQFRNHCWLRNCLQRPLALSTPHWYNGITCCDQ